MNFTIQANFGSFNSITEAAVSEKLINWWNDTDLRQIYCTECFAAIEIVNHLESAGLTYARDRSVKGNEHKNKKNIDLRILVGKTVILKEIAKIPIAGRDGAYKCFYDKGVWNVWIYGYIKGLACTWST